MRISRGGVFVSLLLPVVGAAFSGCKERTHNDSSKARQTEPTGPVPMIVPGGNLTAAFEGHLASAVAAGASASTRASAAAAHASIEEKAAPPRAAQAAQPSHINPSAPSQGRSAAETASASAPSAGDRSAAQRTSEAAGSAHAANPANPANPASVASPEQRHILFVPGFASAEVEKAVSGLAVPAGNGPTAQSGYLDDFLASCARLAWNCWEAKFDAKKKISPSAAALARELKVAPPGTFVVAHGRGGVDALIALSALTPAELGNVGGFITIQSPHGGLVPAEPFQAMPVSFKGLFGSGFSGSDEMTQSKRQAWMEKLEPRLARVFEKVPTLTVGTWLAGKSEGQQSGRSLFAPMSATLGSLVARGKSGRSGLNDGVVAVEDTRLPNVPHVEIKGHDHLSLVMGYPSAPAIDREALLPALVRTLRSP